MTDFYYSSIDNQDSLEIISNMWLSHYNFMLTLPSLTEWEKVTFEDSILSEKVFDI